MIHPKITITGRKARLVILRDWEIARFIGGGCKFWYNKKKKAICKYEYSCNNNKVKNYTVDNVIIYNNKTIRN